MANHSTNINKTNNHLSSYRTEHKKTTLEIYVLQNNLKYD
jgi:hypothetical protein